jgi:hypothetical protein
MERNMVVALTEQEARQILVNRNMISVKLVDTLEAELYKIELEKMNAEQFKQEAMLRMGSDTIAELFLDGLLNGREDITQALVDLKYDGAF